jgi:hypothetical protein
MRTAACSVARRGALAGALRTGAGVPPLWRGISLLRVELNDGPRS